MTLYSPTLNRIRIRLLIEHLALLTQKGFPLQRGLSMVGKDLKGPLGRALQRTAAYLEEGCSVEEAFTASPHSLPPLVRNAAIMGDRSGNLSSFFSELRRSYYRLATPPYNISPFIFHQFILMTALAGIVFIISDLLIPKLHDVLETVHETFSQGNVNTPPLVYATFILLSANTLLVALFGFGFCSPHFSLSLFPFAKRTADRLALTLPLLRGIVLNESARRYSLCTSLFLRAGASLPEAARAAAESEPNRILADRYRRLADQLGEGGRLSSVAQDEKTFDNDFLWFAKAGEASGDFSDYLIQASNHYCAKTSFVTQMALRAFMPLVVLLNGAMVLCACCIIFLPLRDILMKVGPW